MSSSINYPYRLSHLSNNFTYNLDHLLCHISNGKIMDLHPKRDFIEKHISYRGIRTIPLNNSTRCLSKLQCWLWMILSTSARLLNTNKTLCSPKCRNLKPFVYRPSCLKVLAMASMFKNQDIRNLVAKVNSPDLWSLLMINLEFSLLERERERLL